MRPDIGALLAFHLAEGAGAKPLLGKDLNQRPCVLVTGVPPSDRDGNLLLVRHADGWTSAYAHNAKLLAGRGETVSRRQVVAKLGQTGLRSSQT